MNDRSSPPGRFIQELRRRRVFRTAALYVVGSWLVLQVSDVVFPAIGLQDLAVRYVLIALVVGFPAALVFGWFYDVGTHGIRRTLPASPGETADAQPLRRVDYLVLGALVTVIGAIIYNTAGTVVETPGIELPQRSEGPPMVAVLPFTTSSREGDSEFFAAGFHDDLLTQLSKLQSLRVISRTSVMEYKDVARSIRAIAADLRADVVMEGGVQIAGDQIRINAQLIDARTDAHLWADTFDRELNTTNIFEVQSEIARAITAALNTTLTEQDDQQLSVVPTENMAAYRAYRRAMDMVEKGGVYKDPGYRAALEEAVELDPGFTRALAELSGHLSHNNFWGEQNLEEVERAEELLESLRKIAPNSADYLMALAYYNLYTLKDYDQAYEVILQAEEKAPSDIKILEMKTWILRRQGRHAERNDVFRKILKLDPKDRTIASALPGNLLTLHRYDEAAEELAKIQFDDRRVAWMRAVLSLREHRDVQRFATENIALLKEYDSSARNRFWNLWEAYIQARDFEAAKAILDELRRPEFDGMPGLGGWRAGKLVTFWFLGDEESLQEALTETREHFIESRTEELAPETPTLYGEIALVLALEGKGEEVAPLVRRWFRETTDATELAYTWNYACQTLGLAGAAEEAVECILNGLAEPSNIFPFLEPYLPFYDPVRDSPEFQAMLAELEQKG